MTNDFNEVHRNERDKRIVLDLEKHIYKVDEIIDCDSVTNVVGSCFTPFDADYWAARKATAACPAEVIKAQWEEKARIARELGTELHARIEKHYLGEAPSPEALSEKAFNLFRKFAAEHPLTPYRTEWTIFSEEHRLAGTLDFLAINDNGKFHIYDWKRSTKVVDASGLPNLANYGKFAHAPIPHVPDTTYHHYALQLSFYRHILAEKYGILVESAHLGVFHPELDRYYLVKVPYLHDEVKSLLQLRL